MDARTKAAIEYYRTGENGWEERGNFIHKVLEKMLKGQKIKAEGKYEKWIKPLQESDLFQDAEILASEYALCDKERSVGGSFDFLLKTKDGEVILGDLKTTSSLKAAKSRKPAIEQLGAYELMLKYNHRGLKVDKCCTLVVGPEICKPIYSDPEECEDAWDNKCLDFKNEFDALYDF